MKRKTGYFWAIPIKHGFCQVKFLSFLFIQLLFSSKIFLMEAQWPFGPDEANMLQRKTAELLNTSLEVNIDLGSGVNMDFILIPPGRFLMGQPDPFIPNFEKINREIIKNLIFLVIGIFLISTFFFLNFLKLFKRKFSFQINLKCHLYILGSLSLAIMGGVNWWSWRKKFERENWEFETEKEYLKAHGPEEKPTHFVSIEKPFFIGKYEVTQEQYRQVMGFNPSKWEDPLLPVECVSWEDANAFCKKLSTVLCLSVFLPSESQWEYACRGGSNCNFPTGCSERECDNFAWHWGNSGKKTHVVGLKSRNAFGLFDIHGNVSEWVEDDWNFGYEGAPENGSPWIQSPRSDIRVVRGGSWGASEWMCRCSTRDFSHFQTRNHTIGFRIAFYQKGNEK